ncbi:MAG TPA: hypothetical protein VHT26_07435 [Trebonia sp.]|nr:hypothetical protein [Trebonia sp.]
MLASGELTAQEEVLAVRLFERLAQCRGFLAVAAPEVGELAGETPQGLSCQIGLSGWGRVYFL